MSKIWLVALTTILSLGLIEFADAQFGIMTVVESPTSTYHISDVGGNLNWDDARTFCEDWTFGTLLSIETTNEEEFIRNALVKLKIDTVWTSGMPDPSNKGAWLWYSTRRPIGPFTNWKYNSPVVSAPNYRLALFAEYYDSNWQSIPQTNQYHFVCEVAKF